MYLERYAIRTYKDKTRELVFLGYSYEIDDDGDGLNGRIVEGSVSVPITEDGVDKEELRFNWDISYQYIIDYTPKEVDELDEEFINMAEPLPADINLNTPDGLYYERF